MEGIDWNDRQVVIAYDSDAAMNENVMLAEAKLAEVLAGRGANVRVIRLPSPGDEKVGLDDFLVMHGDGGPAELQKLIDNAQPAEAPPPPDLMDWARIFLCEQQGDQSALTIRWWRGEFYCWDGRRYKTLAREELRARMLAWLDQKNGPATPKAASDIVTCIEASVLMSSDVELPAYDDGTQFSHPNFIAMANGILDLEALLAGKRDVPPKNESRRNVRITFLLDRDGRQNDEEEAFGRADRGQAPRGRGGAGQGT